ncbi:hypothetical protein B0H16DRAFT_1565520 [Mycena metata]|uniref:Rad4-domain-containing protein n=1 Tax=Mycena metata TaxID=1033252 RepID=A0AAD7IGD3_9AGAR|nr:hypothetical protein B0H16DRAFT_1565520 [Mycena metata]
MSASGLEAGSESEDDWEEVLVPEEEKHLEITISSRPAQTKKLRLSNAERLLRINCHKLHTLALLTNAWVRNRWINDLLLQARLISLTPLSLQTAFAMIHKSRVPDQNIRGRMFETAMGHLAFWWAHKFFDVTFEGHLRNRTFEDVQKAMQQREVPVDEWDPELLQEVLDDDGELIRGPKSLMKHALMRKGSRDTSAQLFTSLCRGMGIPARLVVSLQSVPWQSIADKAKPKGKGKAKAQDGDVQHDVKGKGKAKAFEDSDSFVGDGQRLDGGPVAEKSEKAKGKEKAKPIVKLRKTKSKGNVLGSSSAGPSTLAVQIDPIKTPPVFWTEVFSRPDGRWFAVDPIRGIVNQPHSFDPSTAPISTYPKTTAGVVIDNRMVYVLAFEEDGYARDVTRRYARQYAAKIAKIQGGTKGRGRKEVWWERVVEGVRRPYRLNRDDVEDAELDTAQLMEGMPTVVSGFKDHPMYVLERHLTQAQTIYPPPPQTRPLGKFRGESVYPRSSVVSLKTSENWMRNEGRRIKEGEQPMKLVKMRASTIGKMREVEGMREILRATGERRVTENGESGDNAAGDSSAPKKGKGKELDNEIMQGLYALSQTELYVPDPIVNGKIPKNNFGNIDMYVPSMLPAGAVHIPYKGTAKIAKQLGFDYAEAVTGFEFKSRRANPIMQGIVIAAENEAAILEAYWEAEKDAAEKARAKKRERVLKRWTRLVHGLRIRQSFQEEYKDRQPAVAPGEQGENVEIVPGLAGGGFITGADAVVKAYQLPKSFLPGADSAGPSGTASDNEAGERPTYDLETMDVDEPVVEEEPPEPPRPTAHRVPKTMQQLAEETAARLQQEFARDDDRGQVVAEEADIPTPPPPTAPAAKAKKARSAKPSRAPSERNPTKTKAKAGGRAPARKRRRTEETHSDSEEEDQDSEPSPAKRAKIGNGNAVPVAVPETAPAAPGGRSLRPRRTKTQTQLQEEEERERAFQRAVAK